MSSPLARQLLGRAAALLPWMEDEAVTEVLVNGVESLYVERAGRLCRETNPFDTREALVDLVERLVIPIGRRVDAAHPYLDGRLLDGSRFHVILPPIAPEGPLLSIRKLRPASAPIGVAAFGPAPVTAWLREQVLEKRSLLLSGGTGSGKTTLLMALLAEVPEEERLVIIEESREIRTAHPHALSLEARPASPDGSGEVTLRALLRNSLRMRPDRIIVGECRGQEAFDMLQAMNTGHPGSLCTLHANGPRDALRRLEALALLAGVPIATRTLREWIGSAVQAVVHLERRGSGRAVREIALVRGLEGEVYRLTPWFREGGL
jgi:pilus assembly protein CpaF